MSSTSTTKDTYFINQSLTGGYYPITYGNNCKFTPSKQFPTIYFGFSIPQATDTLAIVYPYFSAGLKHQLQAFVLCSVISLPGPTKIQEAKRQEYTTDSLPTNTSNFTLVNTIANHPDMINAWVGAGSTYQLLSLYKPASISPPTKQWPTYLAYNQKNANIKVFGDNCEQSYREGQHVYGISLTNPNTPTVGVILGLTPANDSSPSTFYIACYKQNSSQNRPKKITGPNKSARLTLINAATRLKANVISATIKPQPLKQNSPYTLDAQNSNNAYFYASFGSQPLAPQYIKAFGDNCQVSSKENKEQALSLIDPTIDTLAVIYGSAHTKPIPYIYVVCYTGKNQ